MDVHWQILLDSEALALTDTRYLRVMQKMWWLGEDVVDLSTPENAEHRSCAPDNKKQHFLDGGCFGYLWPVFGMLWRGAHLTFFAEQF